MSPEQEIQPTDKLQHMPGVGTSSTGFLKIISYTSGTLFMSLF